MYVKYIYKCNVISKKTQVHFDWSRIVVGYSLAGLEPLGGWVSEERVSEDG